MQSWYHKINKVKCVGVTARIKTKPWRGWKYGRTQTNSSLSKRVGRSDGLLVLGGLENEERNENKNWGVNAQTANVTEVEIEWTEDQSKRHLEGFNP